MKPKYIENYKPKTILAEDTNFKGKLYFKEPVEIKGKFKGEIETESILLISDTASIEADIKAKIVIIAGYVKGNVTASEKVELLPTAKLFGDISTAKLRIADGVIFEGVCHMIKNGTES